MRKHPFTVVPGGRITPKLPQAYFLQESAVRYSAENMAFVAMVGTAGVFFLAFAWLAIAAAMRSRHTGIDGSAHR